MVIYILKEALTVGCLLDGQSVARGKLAAGTVGELQAEIDGSGSGGWGVA